MTVHSFELVIRRARERRSRGAGKARRTGVAQRDRAGSSTLCMQAIPECRKRVWKKEWQQIVGSQTSFLTGTKRTATRHKQRRDGERKREKKKSILQKRDGRMDGWREGQRVRRIDVLTYKKRRRKDNKERDIKEEFMDVALYAMDMTVRVKNDYH